MQQSAQPPFLRYEDYRAMTQALYPDHAHRIAIRQRAAEPDFLEILNDIGSQIAPSNLIRLPQERVQKILLEFHQLTENRREDGEMVAPHTLNFFPEGNPRQADPAPFSYIITMPDRFDSRQLMHRLSSGHVPFVRMKFNEQAVDPKITAWLTFFHELCHACMALGIHPYPRSPEKNQQAANYDACKIETVCDSYAALRTLQIFGEKALPALRLFSDMRLSRMPYQGPEYFTSMALEYVIDEATAKGVEHIRDMSSDRLFDASVNIASLNFMTLDEFEPFHQPLLFAKMSRMIRILELPNDLARIFRSWAAEPRDSRKAKISALHDRARLILWTNYDTGRRWMP